MGIAVFTKYSKDMDEIMLSVSGGDVRDSEVPASGKSKQGKKEKRGKQKDDTEKTIKCGKCDKYFKKKSYVKLHEKRVHKKDVAHDNNDSLNELNTSLDTTIPMENKTEFPDMNSADDTFNEDTDKENEPPSVKSSPKLKNTASFREKSFKCSQCDKMFGKKSYVKMHEKRIHKKKESAIEEKPGARDQNQEPEQNESEIRLSNLTENIGVNTAEIAADKEDSVTLEETASTSTVDDQTLIADTLAIPGPSRPKSPVLNIVENISLLPMSRIGVNRKDEDFKCKVCGLKYQTKRSLVKHFKGHGTYLNLDFLTNFVDKENESSLKNQCLRKSSISLKIPNLKNVPMSVGNIETVGREEVVLEMLDDGESNDDRKMTLDEICAELDDLMDLSNLLS